MQSQYTLKYVPDAVAYTDPMKTHETLMNQRRRWINSSLFAFLYVFKNYYFNVMDSQHNFFRKYITLNISMFIALFSTITSYITPSIFFFVLYSTIIQINKPDEPIDAQIYNPGSEWAARIVSLLYVLILLVAVAGALTGKQWSKRAHIVSGFLSLFTFAMFGLLIYNIINIYLKVTNGNLDFTQPTVVIIFSLTIVNLGFFVLLLIVHLPTHCRFVGKLLMDQISYMAYTGAYAQTMVIHSFCNVDDVSWGTKGSTGGGVKKY